MREEKLKQLLSEIGRVCLCFSGGIDSSYLLKQCLDTLGTGNVLAVIINSDLVSGQENQLAMRLAHEMGANAVLVDINELAHEDIADNTPDSWYYSKVLLYQTVAETGNQYGFDKIIDGMIMDDVSDYRPGMKARSEAGVRSPLQEAGMYKTEIREHAKEIGITNWNKSPSCSVLSRFSYGEKLTKKAVEQVIASELFLEKCGFDTVRVRYHKGVARIEIPESDFIALLSERDVIVSKLKDIGFNFVSLDLEGFSSGHMNRLLTKADKDKYKS